MESLPAFSEVEDTNVVTPSPTTAKNRANRYAFAAGLDDDVLIDDIAQKISAGGEDQVRQELAERTDQGTVNTRSQIVQDIVSAAERANRPLTGEEKQILMNAPAYDMQSPKTVLESEFTKKYLTSLLSADKGNILLQALEGEPDYTNAMLDVAQGITVKKEVLRRYREEQEDRKAQQGLLSTAGDFITTTFVPFRETYGVASELDKNADFLSLITLPGATLQDKIQALYALESVDEFDAKVGEIIQNLSGENSFLVDRFLDEMDKVSNNTALFNNVWNVSEAALLAADVGGIGVAVAKGITKSGAKAVRKAAQDVARAVSDSKGTHSAKQVFNDVGDISTSSKLSAIEDIKNAYYNGAFKYSDVLKKKKFTPEMVPSMFRWDRIIRPTQNLSREAAHRMMREMSKAAEEGMVNFLEAKAVRRRTDDVLDDLVRQAEIKARTRYDGIRASIIDGSFRSVDQSKTAENLGRVYYLVGDEKGEGFTKIDTAYNFVRDVLKAKPGQFEVKQRGQHFFIETWQDLDESLNAWNLDTILQNPDTTTPVSFSNTFIGMLRNPADVLPKFQNIQRDVATFASNETLRVMKEQAELIPRSLNKKERNELARALEALRDYTDDQGNVGRFAKDTFDFERIFDSVNGHYPSASQTEAYFRSILINDFEHFARNLHLRKDKARLGIEEITILGGQSYPDMKIEGKIVDSLPFEGGEDYGLVIFDNKYGDTPKYIRREDAGWDTFYDMFTRAKEQGYKLVQLANPDQMIFEREFDIDDKVHFALMSDIRVNPLPMKQLNYQGGGHKIYRDNHYIKQAKITTSSMTGRTMLRGDTAIINATSEAEAKAQLKMLEEARAAYNKGDRDAFEAAATKMARDPDDLFNKFEKGARDPRAEGALNPKVPFAYTRAGSRSQDAPEMKRFLEENQIADLIDSQYNLYRNINKKFTGERDPDLDASFTVGSESNPVFRMARPRLLDPLAAINKGLTNVMRARAMEDYKIQSVDHYIAEFAHLMDKSTEELLQNPLDALHNPAWKEGMDAGELAAAKNTRMAIRHLLGTPSPLQEKINWTFDKMTSSIWKKYGTEASQRFSDATLWTTKDPFAYARAFAFHTKLGLFNPVQLWLQAQTWSNLAGIAPKQVLPASAAAMKMASLRYTSDEGVIRGIAGMGEKMLGMSQKEFVESYKAMKKTGIFNVGGEVAWRDDLLDPKIHEGPISRFLEKGTLFFKEGERFARLSAWNIAYLQWRRANPGAKLTDSTIGQLVNRTNDLTVNMIRSNNAAYQQGILSLPTQFFSYQLRMAELYMGGRLTTAEKIRMFSAHSMLYGVPVATGAVTAVYPWYEDVRQGFLERGVDVDAPATKALLAGLPALLLKGITGHDYDFAGRYGPGGLSVIKEVMQDEKTFIELIGGASASILLDSASAAAPAWTGTVNFLLGREGPELTSADFTRALSTVSTVNQFNKAYHMITSGNYITKNGIKLGEANNWDAFMISAFGLTNQDVSDTFLRIDSMKDWQNEKKKVEKEYQRQIKNFMNSNDIEDRMTYLRNARALIESAGLTPQERATWISRSFKNVDVVEQTLKEFWEKAPMFQQQQRLQQYLAEQKKKVENGSER